MKKYLIKLNRPVIIDDSYGDTPIKQPVYGFIGPYNETNPEINAYYKESFNSYVSYLAAMHEWSESGEEGFSVNDDKEWTDKGGHPLTEDQIRHIYQRDRAKLGLGYTLYVLDLDDADSIYQGGGLDGSIIISPFLIDKLVERAELQDKTAQEACRVVLFNRPIQIPKHFFWTREEGDCYIYGLASEHRDNGRFLKESYIYLGYLAMIQELLTNGVTPSGYTTDLGKDGRIWYKNGEEYSVKSAEIEAECLLCRRKHMLYLRDTIFIVPQEMLADGAREGLILSQALSEDFLNNGSE